MNKFLLTSCISSVFTPNILQTFNLKENSCISFFIQSHENWGMTNHTFWSIYLLLVDLNRITVPHFKEKFTIKTFFYCFKALRWKFWSLCVKILTPQNSKKIVTKMQILGFDRKCILIYIFSCSWATETYCTSFER